MIIVTGAAGFIGSAMVRYLNEMGQEDLVLVDEFSRLDKIDNLRDKKYRILLDRDELFHWWDNQSNGKIKGVFHLGARTDTTEKDIEIFNKLNLNYSIDVWNRCATEDIPLVYASSAATYGAGEHGYDDDHDKIPDLRPLNPYGQSKQDFDEFVLQSDTQPSCWSGFKFFNVYGPNEFHKGRMASVIFHTVNQINATGQMNLFRSHRPDYKDGHQSRDFVYVKDVVKLLYWFWRMCPPNGIYNLGSGTARTFIDLVTSTFQALGLEPNIQFIDTPIDIRDTYQYFTEANMDKVRAAGYTATFHSLEEGIEDYVTNYLKQGQKYY